jgi:CheY-like chemotaxis protein
MGGRRGTKVTMGEDGRKRAKGLRVLVVDDDEMARGFIVEMLEEFGCKVTSSADSRKAITLFVSGSFDLITLDYQMPGLNGREVHKVLSQEFGAGKRTMGFAVKSLPPVVIVTAHADDPEIESWQQGESVVGVVQKPFAHKKLESIVNNVARSLAEPDESSSEAEDQRNAV